MDEASAVALPGPRQAGKTTLALDVARARPAVYLDLESDAVRAKLSEAELYLSQEEGKHALLGIGDLEALLAHPVAGGSWEGLAIESLIAAAPSGTEAYFYRTSAGAEIDLMLKLPGRRAPWAIEIKRGLAPKIEQGFHLACDAVRPGQRRVVYGGIERFPLAEGAEAVSLVDLCGELSEA